MWEWKNTSLTLSKVYSKPIVTLCLKEKEALEALVYKKYLRKMSLLFYLIYFLKILYLFMFRERVRDGEREGEKHQCVGASGTPPTGDPACNPGMCHDWELNQ